MMRTRICNALWTSFCAREARRYDRACTLVRATQTELLLDTLQKNASTEFGRRHHFHSIHSIDEYRERVPLAEWRDVRPWVDRVAEGRPGVLTRNPVSVLEPTSGSTSIRKLIPYNADLRRQFQRAIRVWLHDLFSKRPALQQGRSYWSISPLANRPEKTRGGIRMGFESDSAYLSSVERVLLLATLAVPPSVAQCQSVEAAQLTTLFHLLNAADLSLISVWSPTFLTRLFDFFATHAERLCDSLRDGQLYMPSHWGESPQGMYTSTRRSSKRAEYVRNCLRDYSAMPALIQALWPQLEIVSCWADGPSTYFANDLQNMLGPIAIQGKGLLATEAFVSIPLISEPAPALAIRSHFFEFLPTMTPSATATLLADELEMSERYEVLVTTGGGLYRYRLRDEVEVVGSRGGVPLLRFVGKTDHTMDLVGEKLNAAHVQQVLGCACAEFGMTPTFAEVMPVSSPQRRYKLLIADRRLLDGKVHEHAFIRAVEAGLRENPGYDYARRLGQLANVELQCISFQEAQQRSQQSIRDALESGARLGDIKPNILGHPAN